MSYLYGGDGYDQEIVDAGMKIYHELSAQGQEFKNLKPKDEKEKSVVVKSSTAVKKGSKKIEL
ncbi:hypothetical protein OA93_15475 [Flavobacterium sp. KMS]|uniref:hypothetical protein n=1 Tax=Flavobacterium sp. KMS TaxID=1566023 RepID=UPI00057C6FF0|nr:hypothetical protein [Flavobacterium sp. KMS]KIA97322.1 hypothetical protein OA93_15475 [Flavobacterium sp. KMS]